VPFYKKILYQKLSAVVRKNLFLIANLTLLVGVHRTQTIFHLYTVFVFTPAASTNQRAPLFYQSALFTLQP